MAKSNSKVQAKIEKGNLVITLPISKGYPVSPSGKTRRVASSEGNIETEVEVEGQNLIVGVNAFIWANPK